MPNLWRLNIKTAAAHGVDPRRFCLDRDILGIGWPIDTANKPGWEAYSRLGDEKYRANGNQGWWPAINALKNRMQIDDLCWTRDQTGTYYLGRVLSGWEYRMEPAFQAADVVNTRNCKWIKVGAVDSVPGKVVNSFIPSRTLQMVSDQSAALYSQFLFNENSPETIYELSPVSPDIFSLISAEDCEDLVGQFLQAKQYSLIPSSCKSDTLAYEFVLKHQTTGKSAFVQVKQGHVDINTTEYSDLKGDVYLFTTQGSYLGRPEAHVHCLNKNQLEKYAIQHQVLLSDRFQRWLKIRDSMKSVDKP